jgi:hypothetical protein
VECPLQEVNVSACVCVGSFGGLSRLAFGLHTREREDELRVLARGGDDALVCS